MVKMISIADLARILERARAAALPECSAVWSELGALLQPRDRQRPLLRLVRSTPPAGAR
jgi:hypothetical protein